MKLDRRPAAVSGSFTFVHVMSGVGQLLAPVKFNFGLVGTFLRY